MSLIKKTKLEKNHYELKFSIDKETFEKALNAAYRKNVAKMNIPGFRKGKAPRAIVEKMYGKGVFYEDAINECLGEAYEAALKESKLDVVGRPEFDIESMEGEEPVLKASVYVKPDVAIEGYLGIEVTKTVKEVTDADVDAEIERVRERGARTIEVTDRAAIDGDTVTIDYEGSVDGIPFDGGKAEGHDLKLGSGQFIPGFEEQIVGKSIDEEFDVNVTFPEEYHAKELAGKAAVFKVKLHAIKATELAELDDEFAKDVSEFDTLEAYKADIRAKQAERNEKQADAEVEDKLIDALVEKMEADIPEVMFEAETENSLRDMDNNLRMQGLDLSTYCKYTGMTLDTIREQMRPRAEKQVKVRLVLEKIAKLEKLTALKKDIEAEYKRIAEAYNVPVDEVKKMIDAKDLGEDLKVKAAIDLVKEKAVITVA
ncbi:MAG: trigger factor [Ruminococcaceae bacterium]|nr:trigger factor [Oscillospiraceae bacterium]